MNISFSMEKRKKIFLMMFDAGGGHRSTANSVKSSIESSGLPWDVRIINVNREIIKDTFGRFSKINLGEDLWNLMLQYNLTNFAMFARVFGQLWMNLFTPIGAKTVRKFMLKENPDFVLSIMPHMNDMYAKALHGTNIPLGVLMSDLIDVKPNVWLTPLVCKEAKFIAIGCQEASENYSGKVKPKFVNSGLAIHPKHFSPKIQKMTKSEARKYFNLDEKLFTIVVVTGGYGNKITSDFIEILEKSETNLQIIACCGKNEPLYNKLKENQGKYNNKIIPIGFTNELHVIMKAADVILAKPGPATIMEGVAMHTPLILYDFHTMPQEVPNASWVKNNKFGIIIKNKYELPSLLRKIISNKNILKDMKEKMIKYKLEDANKTVINLIKKEI